MILNTLAEAIKTQGYIVGLQLSLVVWFLLYCEWSYETLYNERQSRKSLQSYCYIVELKIDNDLVQTNLRIAWQKIEFGISHIMDRP